MDLKDGWIKKLIFNGLEAIFFHNHFVLTIVVLVYQKRNTQYIILNKYKKSNTYLCKIKFNRKKDLKCFFLKSKVYYNCSIKQ